MPARLMGASADPTAEPMGVSTDPMAGPTNGATDTPSAAPATPWALRGPPRRTRRCAGLPATQSPDVGGLGLDTLRFGYGSIEGVQLGIRRA